MVKGTFGSDVHVVVVLVLEFWTVSAESAEIDRLYSKSKMKGLINQSLVNITLRTYPLSCR